MLCCAVFRHVVLRDDYKEGERKKLAQKIQEAAAKQNSYRYSPRMLVLDLQVIKGSCWALSKTP